MQGSSRISICPTTTSGPERWGDPPCLSCSTWTHVGRKDKINICVWVKYDSLLRQTVQHPELWGAPRQGALTSYVFIIPFLVWNSYNTGNCHIEVYVQMLIFVLNEFSTLLPLFNLSSMHNSFNASSYMERSWMVNNKIVSFHSECLFIKIIIFFSQNTMLKIRRLI